MIIFVFILDIFLKVWAQELIYHHDPSMFKEVTVQRKDGAIILSAKNCQLIEKQVLAFNQWKKADHSYQQEKCICSDQCIYDVTNDLPDVVVKSQGVCPLASGPNCLNSTLVSTGLNSVLRYTSSYEMNFWLNSPLCKEREDNIPRPGDIIALRDISDQEKHAFIYISEELSYSKNGYNSEAWHSLQSPQFVYKMYDVSPDCQGITTKAAKFKSPPCMNYSNYFTCSSLEDYLKENSIQNQELLENFQLLNGLECAFNALTTNKEGLQEFLKLNKFMESNLTVVKSLADKKSNEENISKEDKLLWKSLLLKSESLLIQMEILTDTN